MLHIRHVVDASDARRDVVAGLAAGRTSAACLMGQQAALFADRSGGDGWRACALAVARPCYLWLKHLLVPFYPPSSDQRQLSCRRVETALQMTAFLVSFSCTADPSSTFLPSRPGHRVRDALAIERDRPLTHL